MLFSNIVDPSLTVSEGHRIGEEVLKRLNQDIDEVTDVTVHIDPEDDETETPSRDAPMRGVMLERLRAHWREISGAEKILDVALHYLGGKVRIEARIPLDAMSDLEQARRFSQEMAQTAYKDEYVTEVRVLFY